MIKACIFDLDGTLCDSIMSIAVSYNKALKDFDLPAVPTDEFYGFVGDGVYVLTERVIRYLGIDRDEYYDKLLARYFEIFKTGCLENIRPFDGIIETLEVLKKKGVKLAVLSNKPDPNSHAVVEKVFGDRMFDLVLGEGAGVPRKPDPTGALKQAAAFGVKPEECLYCGDTNIDMKTGKGAGMETVGVLWGFRSYEELQKCGADHLIGKPEELLYLFERRNRLEEESIKSGKALSAAELTKMTELQEDIRLIVTDFDGTLLTEGTDNINPDYFNVVRELKAKGIGFIGASGRQLHSMQYLFGPVKDEMDFIAENGAYLAAREDGTFLDTMDRELTLQLIRELREIPDCIISISAEDGMYYENGTEEYTKLMIDGYHNKATEIDDLETVESPFIKVSLYKHDHIEDYAAELKEKWEKHFSVTIAGDIWLDFMTKGVSKGNAVKHVMKSRDLKPSQIMVFGDNLNDLPMLALSDESYAIGNARVEVKEKTVHVCDMRENDGVLKTIRRRLL